MVENEIERTPNKLIITDLSCDFQVSLIAERDDKGEIDFYIDQVGESYSYSVTLNNKSKQALIEFLQEK